MKLSLTIEGSPAVIAAVLASLDGAAVVTAPVAIPSLTTGDDDDNGPVDPTAPELDASGLPWDARIHAASKNRVSNGTWRRKRNMTDEAAAPIEAELRAKLTAPIPTGIALGAPVAAPVSPMPIAMPVMTPVPQMVQPVMAPVAMPEPVAQPIAQPVMAPVAMPPMQPVPQPLPVAQPEPQPVAAATGEIDMTAFMQHFGAKMNERDANGAPLIHADYLAGVVNEINGAFGPQGIAISVITDIASNPALINYAVQILQRDGRW